MLSDEEELKEKGAAKFMNKWKEPSKSRAQREREVVLRR